MYIYADQYYIIMHDPVMNMYMYRYMTQYYIVIHIYKYMSQ